MEPYRVPFQFDRSRSPHYRLTNVGGEHLRGITFSLLGPGLMSPILPGRLAHGRSIDVRIGGEHLERGSALLIRWIRPDGDDYLWRVAL